MKPTLNLIRKSLLIVGIVAPCFIVFFYCLPVIDRAADSLSMIKYFDRDEHILIEFAMRLYQHGVLPQELTSSYPKFFYYLCGLFLYPYTYFFGPDAKVIAVTFRFVNTLAMALTAVVVNALAVRFLKSRFVGIVSALLFVLTPAFIGWGTNSRPHPFEILLITLSMYWCLSAVETRRMRSLWVAVFWAGLATGTKYGGVFLVPTILMVYVYLIRERGLNKEFLRPEGAMGNVTAFLFGGGGLAVLSTVYYVLFWVKRRSTGRTFAQELGWQQALASWPFYMGIVAGVGLLVLGVLFLLLNRKMIRLYENVHGISDHRVDTGSSPALGLCGYKVVMFGIKVSLALGTLFLLTNIDWFIFPINNLSVLLGRALVTSQGTHPDPRWWVWFTRFPEAMSMGIGGVLIVLHYLLIEFVRIRRNLSEGNQIEFFKRLTLLSYPTVLLSFLVVGVTHRPHHYLLPVFLFLFVLGVDSLARTARQVEGVFRHRAYQVLCAVLILLCLVERLPALSEGRALLRAWKTDPAVAQLAPWLSSTYPESVKVMSDDALMYVPDSFSGLCYWKAGRDRVPGVQEDAYRSISEVEPRVFIRSSLGPVDTTGANYKQDVAYLAANYSVVKRISYSKKTRPWYGLSDEIVVYEKVGPLGPLDKTAVF